jgi:hypothetical protein
MHREERPLKWIKQMTSWKRSKLHLLTTSLPEEDIAKNLRLLYPDYVDIKQDLITRDVKRYIDCILDGEDAFDRWNDDIKAKIKSKLLKSAGGMFVLFDTNLTVFYSRFRLASLQISELQDCHNEDELEGQLQCLPHDLDEVYDRIISGIKRLHEDALTILQWLPFSARPLKLAEVVQVTGVVPDADQCLRFKPSRVLADPHSVLAICSSLVTEIDGLCLKRNRNISLTDHVGTVKLSHMSVKDYLLSRHRVAATGFGIDEKLSHSHIAQTCSAYLLQFDNSDC